MESKLNYDKISLETLNENNLKEVHEFCEKNIDLFHQPYQFFKLATLGDSEFNENLTIVCRYENNEIIGFFMGTTRRGIPFYQGKNVLKFFIVKRELRRKGLGTFLLNQLYSKFKLQNIKGRIDALCSPPDYWFPGVSMKFTPAIYWLKKNGFKKSLFGPSYRLNLCVELDNNPYLKFDLENPPPKEFENIEFQRVNEEYFEKTYQLVKKHHGLGVWPQEVRNSFKNDPPTTFIAIQKDTKEVIGWATHSAHFEGSFGPTGVLKSLRGKGIGGILFYWTLYDLKQKGLKKCHILWVGGETVKYYSKVAGAYISEICWLMTGKIR